MVEEKKDILQGDLLWLGVPAPTEISKTDHTHPHLDELADIVTLLNNGVTGSKTVGGYTLTFNHGVLVGFEAV